MIYLKPNWDTGACPQAAKTIQTVNLYSVAGSRELSMMIVSSMMVASMMMTSMVEAVKEMMKERFGLSLASPNSRCRISPAAVRPRWAMRPASAAVVLRRDSAGVVGTRPQTQPPPLGEGWRGHVEAEEDGEEDELDLHVSTSWIRLVTLQRQAVAFIW